MREWQRKAAMVAARVAGGAILRPWFSTWRVQVVGGDAVRAEWVEARRPALYLIWHSRLLMGAHAGRDAGLATLISQHRDGDYIARVVEGWGFRVIRGSSTRGGTQAMAVMLRSLREGWSLALTPDGPQGPPFQLKPGALAIAQRAGVPIIPVAASADRAWRARSWDGFVVPKPFAQLRVAFGRPRRIERGLGPVEVEAARERLERELNALTALVDDAAAAR